MWAFFSVINKYKVPSAVADPGFPREGESPTLESGAQTYYLAKFLPKTAWKWKKWTGGGCVPSAPLDPPTGTPTVEEENIITVCQRSIFQSCLSVTGRNPIYTRPKPPYVQSPARHTGPPSLSPRDMLKLVQFGPHFTSTLVVIQ